MASGADQLAASLVTWLHTLEVPGLRSYRIEDLADGVAIANGLHQIAPDVFDADKLAKIKSEDCDKETVRAANIRWLKRGMGEFIDRLPDDKRWSLSFPEVDAVTSGDQTALIALLELLLGCAVHGPQKEQYVTKLMSLEQEVKGNLVRCIQRLVVQTDGRDALSPDVLDGDTEGYTPSQVQQLLREKDDLMQMYEALQKDHEATLSQLDAAQGALEDNQNSGGVAASPGAKLSAGGGGDVTRLQQELHSARTEMSQVKQALEDERQEQAEVAREHTTEITELRQKLERAEQRASLADRMQDEMEELREKEAELAAAQRSIERYKDKIQELTELQQEAADMAKENSASATRIEMLEETERKVLAMQQAAAKSAARITQLENDVLEEKKRGDTLRFELNAAKEEVLEASQAKQQLVAEKRDLQARVRELQEEQDGSSGGSSLSQLMAASSSNAADSEKLAKLEAENALLKASNSGSDSLQTMIDDLATRKGALEAENRSQNLEILTLKNELKKMEKKGVKDTGDVAIEQLALAERDLKKFRTKSEKLETELRSAQEELITLKKAASLAGLDQSEMAAKIEADVRAEVGTAQAALEKQVVALRAELADVSKHLTTAKEQIATLEEKNERLNEIKDEKTERLTAVLEEKDSLHSRLGKITDEHNERIAAILKEQSERLKAQEAKFETRTAELETRMKGDAGAASKEEMLQLQLKVTQLDNELMKADRVKADAVAKVQEELRKKEAQLDQYQASVKDFKDSGKNLGGSVKLLQTKLDEKTREYERERQHKERLEHQHRREQQLMVSAWYDLGLRYQRLSAERGTMSGGSFLAKQRQASMSTPRK